MTIGSQANLFALSEYGGAARLNTVDQEAAVLHRLRWRIFRTTMHQLMLTSRLRMSLVTVLSIVFWAGMFMLFFQGFEFLARFISPVDVQHAEMVGFIYDVFFGSLMLMLTFSSAIIVYGGLYRSRETDFLLTLPVRSERIVLYKFQAAMLFSSWGFFLLGSPMLLAYGVSAGAPWHYYVLLIPFMMAFAYIPCSIGTIACLLVVHWIPRTRMLALVLVTIAAVVFGFLSAWSVIGNADSNILTPGWFEDTIRRFAFSRSRFLPSWWLSTGLLEAARRDSSVGHDHHPWAESIMFLAVLLSNAMVLHILTPWIGKRVFRSSFSGLHGEPRRPWNVFHLSERFPALGRVWSRPTRQAAVSGAARVAWIDRVLMRLLGFLDYRVRLLLIKDLRVFRRDPVQWSQVFIFFGLLALYFINIRRLNYDVQYTGWVNMVSFLNLAVVGLILSTFTTRFIFPMISLEGSRFWILGLLPIRRETILWSKFLFAVVGSIIPCTVLILISDLMLRISPMVLLLHQLTCVILCMGLSGIAVGLGAKMPDLREQSPSKIAAGFGGTLNLVLSAMYIVAVVLLIALPCHFYVADKPAEWAKVLLDPAYLRMWLTLGTFGAIVLGIIATFVPLRIGLRAFRDMEF